MTSGRIQRKNFIKVLIFPIDIVFELDSGDIAFGSMSIGIIISSIIFLIYYFSDSNPDPKDFDKREKEKEKRKR
jgi:hypothetical protein